MNTPAPLDAEQAEERVLGWQTKLHRWAGEDEEKRFGDLFNLVCDRATLLVAWEWFLCSLVAKTPIRLPFWCLAPVISSSRRSFSRVSEGRAKA